MTFRQRSLDSPSKESTNVNAGIVWERLSIGYRVEDLGKNRFDEALSLAKEDFFASEPMCKATLLAKDKTSVETYLDLITTWMKELRSMCAIHEGSGKLVGIAVANVNSKADREKDISRVRMSQGEAIFKILTLKSCVFGLARLYEKYEIAEYLRLHVLCVDNAFRNKMIGTALVRSCVESCLRLQLPACIGGFSSGAARTIADRLGFETLSEIPYREYFVLEKSGKPLIDVSSGNYSVACMGLRTTVPSALSRAVSRSTSLTSASNKKKKKKKKSKESKES